MEIVNFFEKMAGRWFSQRTTHALSTQQSKAGKSDLEIEFLPAEDDAVQQLWQQQGQGAAKPLCGLSIQQSSTIEGDSKPSVSTTLLVPLAAANGDSGSVLRSGSTLKGSYSLEDEVLTIVNETDEAHSTERMWFINDNLRMRTGITDLKNGPQNGLRIASFCSEIRLGVKPPKAD